MFRVSLIGDDLPQHKRVQQFARDYPDLALQSFEDNVIPFVELRLNRTLRRLVPPPPNRKIEWTTPKQMRAYFATDGFGHGIPYVRRRPGIESKWRVDYAITGNGARVSIVNDDPASPFVYGRWKQRFHTNTGWPDARPIIDSIAAATRPEVVTDQILLARSVFGTR